ncbi:MAG: hypothetical protein ACTSPB_19155, partial [Candidatus Thorarchaeota archaeon]
MVAAGRSKGQIFSTDIMIAVGIFLLLLGFCFIVWNGILRTATLEINREKTFETTYQILDMLVRSPGIPSYWNRTNVQSIGLAKSDRVLDQKKVEELLEMPESEVAEKFGIGTLNYTIYFLESLTELKIVAKWKDIGYYYRLAAPEVLDPPPCCETSYNSESCGGETDKSFCRYLIDEIKDADMTLYGTGANPPTDWNDLLDDISNYDVVVFEDTALDNLGGREDELRGWLLNGGVLIVTGDSDFVKGLVGLGGSGRGNAEGEIVNLGDPKILEDVDVGWCYSGGFQGSKFLSGSCTLPGDSSPGTCHDFIGLMQMQSGEYYGLQVDYGDEGGMVYTLVSPYGDIYDNPTCSGTAVAENFNIAGRLFRT